MAKKAKKRSVYGWRRFDDEKLLDQRICDLGLKMNTGKVNQAIKQVYNELDRAQLEFRPHFWLGEEFFTPEGIPGVAIPFYLADPRLEKLEKKQMFEAEGSDPRWLIRILRHEVGHAIDHAYRLTRRRERQRVFGKASLPYPDTYKPRPYSKSFVVNLENWYAQAHPVEDFAETFAVWLKPSSFWRSRYKGWPALKKLECMHELMKSLRGKKPPVRTKAKYEPVEKIRKTLREYYTEKKERFGLDYQDDFYDRDLFVLFSSDPSFKKNTLAYRFIRKKKKEFRRAIATWTGQYHYAIDEVLEEVIARCEELKLRLMHEEEKTRNDLLVMLTVHAMNYIHKGGYNLAM